MKTSIHRARRSGPLGLLAGLFAVAVLAGGCQDHPTGPQAFDGLEPLLDVSATSTGLGGPVILLGLDSELDPGDGTHGTRAEHAAMAQSILDNVTNGGSGIVVIGASGFTQTYWNNLGTDLGQAVTFVEGAAAILAQSFDGFAMIGVASSDFQMFDLGGLTNAENDALVTRAADVVAFVNAGGGLLGKTQDGLTNQWGYVDPLGEFTVRSNEFTSVIVTQAGLDLGLTQAGMDGWCCYHETFPEFPSFLDVLIINNLSGTTGFGEAAALGGAQVVLVPPGIQACTPGFWRNDGLRTSAWTGTGWDPDDAVTAMFSNAALFPQLAGNTLLETLGGGGGPGTLGAARILLRAAVAAVLNEESFGAAYPAESVAALQDDVNAALASDDRDEMLELATLLDWFNNNFEVDEDGNLVLDEDGNPVVGGNCPLSDNNVED